MKKDFTDRLLHFMLAAMTIALVIGAACGFVNTVLYALEAQNPVIHRVLCGISAIGMLAGGCFVTKWCYWIYHIEELKKIETENE